MVPRLISSDKIVAYSIKWLKMGSNPDPDSPAVHHRRRRVGVWKSTPIWVKICAGFCLAFLAASPWVKDWWAARHPADSPSREQVTRRDMNLDKMFAEAPKLDLALSQSTWNEATRRIEGLVTNTSDRPYSDVSVTFYLPGPDLNSSDEVEALVPSLGPHESAKFATKPLETGNKRWLLKRISGTPR